MEIIILFCIMMPWIFALILPMTHKIFRNSTTYTFSIIISLGLLLMFLLKIKDTETDKELYFASALNPITFLLFYKFFDFIIIKKYNRHLYFYANFIGYKDGESENKTWLDFLLQLLLPVISVAIFYIGNLIFKV